MFSEERTSWEKEMLIREAISNAQEHGFFVQLKNGSRIFVTPNASTIDIIIYGLEKIVRDANQHQRSRMTFIDFMYYWHERLFNRIRKRQHH